MSNPWQERGRMEKAVHIESVLRDAGIDSVADLDRITPEQREMAERAAALARGVQYRPASDCGADHADPPRCCTWAQVRDLFVAIDRTRGILRGDQ